MARRFIWLSAIVMALLGVPLWVMQLTGPVATDTGATAGAIYPSAPILRIEVGQHTASATSMSVDGAGDYLVTGGHDKTVRIWTLPDAAHPDPAHADLELLDVLRPPIAEGDAGKIYAVAISPDGKLIAAGGYTGVQDKGDHPIYIFNRASGAVVARLIAKLPERIYSLAFSADGHTLAAGQRHGLSLWRSEDGAHWHELAADSDYGYDIYGLAFDQAGHLATASYDGQIRLYDQQMKRIARVPAPGSALPFGIAFSPDGTKLVVGYADSSAVAVLDGRSLATLRLLQEPGDIAAKGAESDNDLGSVTWSADGRYVFAGGFFWSGSASLVRRWDVTNGSEPQDFDALGNTSKIHTLAPYGSSGVLVLGADPFIGAYDGSGNPVFASGPVERDTRKYVDNSDYDAFRVSNDGSVVEIPGFHQPLVRFDLAQRRLSEIAQSDIALAPPQTTSDAFEVTHWLAETHPMLQRAGEKEPHALALEQYEVAESLAAAPRSKRFVLGTDWFLRLYSDTGKLVWRKAVPGVAWRVNVTPDEKLVVAAFGDGTVRWYDVEKGKELLALFVREPDAPGEDYWSQNGPAGSYYPSMSPRLWIAWTPNGYYDTSPGGERLIGWHINRGADKAALFYPADRFRNAFYRPELIAQVLKTRVVPKAPPTDTIIAHLPPVVRILDVTRDANGDAHVSYEVESPSGKPITAVDCVIGGIPCTPPGTKGLPGTGKQTVDAKVPPGASKVFVSASTADGQGITRSAPISSAIPEHGLMTGKLFALVIGVSNYKDPALMSSRYRLHYADQDAIEFAKALKAQKGKIYSDVIVETLTNEKATRLEILQKLAWLRDTPTKDDVSLLFISGHGQSRQQQTGKESKEYYFMPYDVDFTHDLVAGTGVSAPEIISYINGSSSDGGFPKKLVFLDTCHSGQVDANGMINILSQNADGKRVTIWTSSSGTQDSLERSDWKHGAFTYAILDALYGRQNASAMMPKGRISPRLLGAWLDQRVDSLTDGKQTPWIIDASGSKYDFAAVVQQP